jgi:hypothetical protein
LNMFYYADERNEYILFLYFSFFEIMNHRYESSEYFSMFPVEVR